MQEIALRMEDIHKTFPGVKANNGINIDLYKGEVLALLGENGCGKSTLMNILYGFYQADSGKIFVNGQEMRITSSKVAIKHGIGMIHQHFMLIPVFTALENIILGLELEKGISLNKEAYRKEIEEISQKYHLGVSLDTRIMDMSVGEQQKVEIIKCLFRNAQILILDEPTAVLTPRESEDLFQVIKRFTADGKSVIFISHKMDELMEFSNRITVLRSGQLIKTFETKDTSIAELASTMVGHKVDFVKNQSHSNQGEVRVEIQDIFVKDKRGVDVVKGVSLDIREGEIVGLAGIDGNGQNELSEALMGLREITAGSMRFRGAEVTNHPVTKLAEAGFGFIPPDRKEQGLVLDYSIRENLVVDEIDKPNCSRKGMLRHKAIRKQAEQLIEEFDIRPALAEQKAKTLSGGNQQKIIVARVFNKNPQFLIAVNPIRGIDIKATEFIHQKILELKQAGASVLLISTDLEEIFNISDRIAVICGGKIIGVESTANATIEQIGLMMTGIASEVTA